MKTTTFTNGIEILNCTPHTVKFRDGENIVSVPASGYTLLATPKETSVNEVLVTTLFEQSDKGLEEIKEIKKECGENVLIVGSIISAQAYPMDVVSIIPTPGEERMNPAERTYRSDRFNCFTK